MSTGDKDFFRLLNYAQHFFSQSFPQSNAIRRRIRSNFTHSICRQKVVFGNVEEYTPYGSLIDALSNHEALFAPTYYEPLAASNEFSCTVDCYMFRESLGHYFVFVFGILD